jgi:GNAT superfamily N-acetyltransferase
LQAVRYSAVESLRDGRAVEIRALRPDDRDSLFAALGRASAQSLYRRFFSVKRDFTEKETSFFLDVDFTSHVGLVAVVEEAGRSAIVAGGRYVVVGAGRAEAAFAVIDQFQGQGVGKALLRHLVVIARTAGLQELIAEVLPENIAMLKVFEKSGLPLRTNREAGAVHVALQLNPPGRRQPSSISGGG